MSSGSQRIQTTMKSTKSLSSFCLIVVLSSFIVLVQCQLGRNRKQKSKGGTESSSVCQLEVDPGQCFESIRRFYFDASSGECQMFQWTGCDGNANRFNSKRICEKKCRTEKGAKRCPSLNCDDDQSSCRFGRVIGANGCETCECKENPMCSTERCFMQCPFGYAEDEYGCRLCECLPPKCTPVSCHMNCEYGFKSDEFGCKVCKCEKGVEEKEEVEVEEEEEDKEKEMHRCSPVMCAMYCERGFVKDRHGCDVCQCVEGPMTATTPRDRCGLRPMCAMYCPLGFQKDSNGCSICRCVEPPPSTKATDVDPCSLRPVCLIHCSDGFVKDADGCDRCECVVRRTPPPKMTTTATMAASCPPKTWFWCLKLCTHGYAKGPDGCDICQCHEAGEETEEEEMKKEEEREEEEETSQTERDEWEPEPEPEQEVRPYCSPVRCRMYCKHGFQTDDQGCEICKCREVEEEEKRMPSCSPITCYMYCEHGFAKDERGCDVCRCVVPPSTPSPLPHRPVVDHCPGRPTCRMFCPYGYERDSDGCDRCACFSPTDSIDYARARQAAARCSSNARCRKQCFELGGFKSDANGCMLCECVVDENAPRKTDSVTVDIIIADARKSSCSLPPEVGSCRATIERWHYNPRTRRCETFRYGGCRGNANNFLSEKSCIKYCKPEVNQEPKNWKSRYLRMIGML